MKNTVLESFQNRDVPFEELVDALQPERNLGGNLLFQIMFVFHDRSHTLAWRSALRLEGAVTLPEMLHNGTAKFDLSVTIERRILTSGFESVSVLCKDSVPPGLPSDFCPLTN